MQPPLLPEESLRRVLRSARLDGITLLVVAGLFAVISAALGDRFGAGVGILIAAAGAIELHGASLLHGRRPRGMNWLVASQIYLLCAVLGYVIWRLLAYDEATLRHLAQTVISEQPQVQAALDESGATEADVVHILKYGYLIGYMAVGVLTFFYQGGMALYYHRRRRVVAAALGEKTES